MYKYVAKNGIKFLTLALGVIGSFNQVRADDCQIFQSAVKDKISQFSGGNCCSYNGVKCENGSITEIEFPDYMCGHGEESYVEEATKMFANLPNLKSFMVKSVHFCNFPNSVCQLKNLKSLTLNVGSNGSMPECFSELTNLEYLDLDGCSFSGTIPYSFGNLTKLKTLKLSGNDFEGYIPYSFNNFKDLEELDLYNTKLTGYIPEMPNIKTCRYTFTSLCKSETTTCTDNLKYCKKSQLETSNKNNGNPHPEDFSYFKEHRYILTKQKTKLTYIPCGAILVILIVCSILDCCFKKTHDPDQLLEVTTQRKNQYNHIVSSNTRVMTARQYLYEQRAAMVILAIAGVCIWIFLE